MTSVHAETPDDRFEGATTSMLARLLEDRHSCRAFRPEPVPRPVIEAILQLAQRTPSWCNTQPWHVHVVSGEAVDRLRTELPRVLMAGDQVPDLPFPHEYAGVYRSRRKDSAMRLYASVGVADGDRAASTAQTMQNFDLFGAPHVAIITTEAALGVYGAVDCGLYLSTFLLAAQSFGIATVPQAALATCSPYLRDLLSIPGGRHVVCGVSFGYAEEGHRANAFRTDRAGLGDTVSWLD